MASAAQAALDSFTQLLAGQTAELNAQEERIRREREELEEERRMMRTIEARDTDVIHLNVGGKPFTTTRRTLCAEPDTMLARLFSGRIVRDDQNRVYLDYDPALFAILLNYLRSKDIAPPGTKVSLPPPSEIPPLQQQTYKLMLNYLGFSKPGADFTFAQGTANFTVSDQGKKAVCTGGSWVPILTEQIFEPDVSVWRVKVTAGSYVMLGIVKQNTTVTSNMYTQDGYLFYNASSSGYAKAAGAAIATGNPFAIGHTVAISLSSAGVLTLKNESTGVTHTLPATVQMTDTYKFVHNAHSANHTVEILE